jgi:hypothetical protein
MTQREAYEMVWVIGGGVVIALWIFLLGELVFGG